MRHLVWFSCGAAANGKTKRVRIFLDEMHPDMGRDVPMPDIECGVLCVNDPANREEAEAQFAARHDI